jgi:hypothetical protein
VLRHEGLGETERLHEVVDRAFAPGEDVEDLPPARLGDGVERVCGGRGSGHSRASYTHMRICQIERARERPPASGRRPAFVVFLLGDARDARRRQTVFFQKR